MTVSDPPDCPRCGLNDGVIWASQVQKSGAVAAQRWVCVECEAIFGTDGQFRLPKRWMLVGLAILTILTFPLVWWRRRAMNRVETAASSASSKVTRSA